MIRQVKVYAAAVLAGLLFSQLPANPLQAEDKKPPEVSHDGLHLLKDSKLALVYAKPGLDLSPYDKFMLLDCYVAFKKNWRRNYNNSALRRVTEKDMDKIKKLVAKTFREEMIQELDKKGGYPLVDKPAADVLLIRPAIIDLVVTAPDTMSPNEATFVSSAGSETLYVELYDSVSSEILVRAIDRRADPGYGGMEMSSRVSNVAAERRMVKYWADALRKQLNDVHSGDVASSPR